MLRLPHGSRVGERYEVESVLGRTPYGELYRARELGSGAAVTLLALAPALVAEPAAEVRLEREVEVARLLEHKNVAATHGLFRVAGEGGALLCVVSEHVEGQTLRAMLDKKRSSGRAFSLKGAYNVAAHLCNALIHVDAVPVAGGRRFHGALTLEAVMVSSAGRVKVTDYGLGRALGPRDLAPGAGLSAIAPEMVANPEGADARADVYSIGVILFELLTGRAPADAFERPSVAAPGVPIAIDPVIERCLEPAPEARWPSIHAFKEALQSALAADLAGPQAQLAAALAAGEGRSPTDRAAAAAAAAQLPRPTPATPWPIVPATAAATDPSTTSASPSMAQSNSSPPNHRPPPPAPPSPPAGAPPTPRAAPPVPTPPVPTPPAPTPRPAAPRVPPAAAVPASFSVDAALGGGAVDDGVERWLIQKDKLDFGPFSLGDVRAQIESGKIQGEHTIVDTENGERRRVKDHPQLRQLVLDCEARLALEAREAEEAAARSKQRGRVLVLLGAIFAVLVVGGGGLFWYLRTHQPKVVVQKEVVHDGDYDFLKNVEITMKVDPPAKKKPGARHTKPKGKNQFDDVTNLGDASDDGGGEETLDQATVQRVMAQNFKVLSGCLVEERRRDPGLKTVEMDFVIKGSGTVAGVKVNGQTGSPLASCMYGKMQTIAFPKFNGAKTTAQFTLNLAR